MATSQQQQILEQIMEAKKLIEDSVSFIESQIDSEVALLDKAENEEQQMQHARNLHNLTGKLRFERREFDKLSARINSLNLGVKILSDLKNIKKVP